MRKSLVLSENPLSPTCSTMKEDPLTNRDDIDIPDPVYHHHPDQRTVELFDLQSAEFSSRCTARTLYYIPPVSMSFSTSLFSK